MSDQAQREEFQFNESDNVRYNEQNDCKRIQLNYQIRIKLLMKSVVHFFRQNIKKSEIHLRQGIHNQSLESNIQEKQKSNNICEEPSQIKKIDEKEGKKNEELSEMLVNNDKRQSDVSQILPKNKQHQLGREKQNQPNMKLGDQKKYEMQKEAQKKGLSEQLASKPQQSNQQFEEKIDNFKLYKEQLSNLQKENHTISQSEVHHQIDMNTLQVMNQIQEARKYKQNKTQNSLKNNHFYIRRPKASNPQSGRKSIQLKKANAEQKINDNIEFLFNLKNFQKKLQPKEWKQQVSPRRDIIGKLRKANKNRMNSLGFSISKENPIESVENLSGSQLNLPRIVSKRSAMDMVRPQPYNIYNIYQKQNEVFHNPKIDL